jgi:DNA polymerase III subunit chi
MTGRVDIYLLETDDSATRRITACRLIEKIYRQGLTVFAQVENDEEAQRFDDLLWTFRQGSFVPHEPFRADSQEAPVVIGSGPSVPGSQDVLINLSANLPEGYEIYPRIAEIVDQDPAIRSAGRLRYRQYQSQGMDIQTHQL